MKSVEIEVFSRTSMTKNELSRFRSGGNVPAVLYGKHIKENLMISFPSLMFNKLLNKHGRSSILVFKSEDSKLNGTSALIKEVQRDSITDILLNVDLIEIRKDEKISVKIPVEFVGEAPGLKQGGTLDVQRRQIELECLPTDIPEKITVDISGLELNETIHISDLKLADGIKVLDDPSYSVISIKVVRVKEETPAATEGAEGTGLEGTAEATAAAADSEKKDASPAGDDKGKDAKEKDAKEAK
jgi:large subunit ribosomal protein L25